MCSNYQPVQRTQSTWVKQHFDCDLPFTDWREEAYPTYPAPFIYLDEEKPSFRAAWKERRFGLSIMQSFYEPNWESGKAIRWRIKRADLQPIAVASIWERVIDKETG